MERSYSTPAELVAALHGGAADARALLWQWLGPPLGRLMEQLAVQHPGIFDRERLTRHALHAAETWLRTRPVRDFEGLGWPAFRAAVLLHVGRLAFRPFGGREGPAPGPEPLPESPAYFCRTVFLPHDRVGDYWFGGDWFGGVEAADGSLWVLLADVTGHGYYAYLLASALPGVWQHCWELAGPAEPADLLAAMHGLLEGCLPEGIYAECTLARLTPQGEVTVAPAGGTRFLIRRAGRADLMRLRGTWLGLLPPSPEDQRSWQLEEGDELLLGTDGVFDHLAEVGGADALVRVPPGETLFEEAERLLRQALAKAPQTDDITMVLLRRRAPTAIGPATLPFRSETGDVPV
jgi:hypothetical protein